NDPVRVVVESLYHLTPGEVPDDHSFVFADRNQQLPIRRKGRAPYSRRMPVAQDSFFPRLVHRQPRRQRHRGDADQQNPKRGFRQSANQTLSHQLSLQLPALQSGEATDRPQRVERNARLPVGVVKDHELGQQLIGVLRAERLPLFLFAFHFDQRFQPFQIGQRLGARRIPPLALLPQGL